MATSPGEIDPPVDTDPRQGDALAPGLIHEMRHPLMAIKAGLQMLARTIGKDVCASEEWMMVASQLTRLEEIFSGYQEFLHPEHVSAGPFPLGPAINRAVELLRYRIRRLGDKFSIQLPQESITVFGTPNALVHTLTNVLMNALDAIDEAGGQKRLELRALVLPGSEAIELRVSDEGSGIKPAVAARLFNERVTSKPPGKGSGLGLSVAARMVGSYGGSIRVVPPGEGRRASWASTELCIVLRTAKGATTAYVPTETPAPVMLPPTNRTPLPQKMPGQASAPGLRILLVDDEIVITRLLETVLASDGHRVTAANSGERGAELIGQRDFDLVITDKNMPGISGVELLRLARARKPDIMAMLITAYPSKESAAELRMLGADDYVQKPFELDELRLRITELRERKRAPQQRSAAPAGSSRIALVGVSPPESERLAALVRKLGGAAIESADVSVALASTPPFDVLVVPVQHIDPKVKRAIWRSRIDRPALQLVLISDRGLADELAAIAVGTRLVLPRPFDDGAAEALLRSALGRGP